VGGASSSVMMNPVFPSEGVGDAFAVHDQGSSARDATLPPPPRSTSRDATMPAQPRPTSHSNVYANDIPRQRPVTIFRDAPGDQTSTPTDSRANEYDYFDAPQAAPIRLVAPLGGEGLAVTVPPPGEYASLNAAREDEFNEYALPTSLSLHPPPGADGGGDNVYSHIDRAKPRVMTPRLAPPGQGQAFFSVRARCCHSLSLELIPHVPSSIASFMLTK
jgi:hypothetical protein